MSRPSYAWTECLGAILGVRDCGRRSLIDIWESVSQNVLAHLGILSRGARDVTHTALCRPVGPPSEICINVSVHSATRSSFASMLASLYHIVFALISCPLVALTLASPVRHGEVDLHRRANQILIGYRRVEKVDADKYMKYGTILDTSGRGWQLGQGAYMAGGTHDWIMGGKYVCFVYVDPGKWAQTPKVWIPEYDETRPGARVGLWEKVDRINTYIRSQFRGLDPARTLRFGRIQGDEKTMQLVIPPALQGKTSLGLVVNCVQESQVPLGVFPTLNYVSLTKEWNILGVSPALEHKMYLPGIRPEYGKRPSPARSVKSHRRRK